MKTGLMALAAALTLPCVSAQAATNNPPPIERNVPATQEDVADEGFGSLGDMLGLLFGTEPEPLAPEAEARLPLAQEVAADLFPAGVFQKVMDGTMSGMFSGLMEMAAARPTETVIKLTGLDEESLGEFDSDTLSQAALILDPAYVERNRMKTEALTAWMGEMMNAVEPLYRDGYARAFASRFTEQQLADLKTFFETPSGAHFASEFLLLGTDAQVMGKSREMLPLMLAGLPAMIAESDAAMAALPGETYFDQLPGAKQKQIAALLGFNVDTLTALASSAREISESAKAQDKVENLLMTPATDGDGEGE